MTLHLNLVNEAATRDFADDLAMILKKGDFVALSGDLGTGKSTLARALIRTLARNPCLEVPSPTFSLMQHYEGEHPTIIHADLYRLSDSQEIEELGLMEWQNQAILLLEWPERGAGLLPLPDFALSLDYAGEGRRLMVDMTPEAEERLARSLEIRDFLVTSGEKVARRYYLAGDASSRRYETIWIEDEVNKKYVLMDGAKMHPMPSKIAPNYASMVNLAQDIRPFVGMARLLGSKGFSVPQIFASDLERGLLLLEHLGEKGIIDEDGAPITVRYLAAAELLADIHATDWPSEIKWSDLTLKIPLYDRPTLYRETVLLLDWYLPNKKKLSGKAIKVSEPIRQHYQSVWEELLDRLQEAEQGLCLRDYHSPNLIWRQNREGHEKIGIIDFQDALIGPTAYDLASLAQDARASVSPALESALIDVYCHRRKTQNRGFDEAGLRRVYPIAATQRVTKILGLFVRLDRRDNKPYYLAHLPRLIEYLQRNLANSDLVALRDFCQSYNII